MGTSCSEPIVCISNNDVPKNAPYLAMHIPVSSAWPKWQLVPLVSPVHPLFHSTCQHTCIHTSALLQTVFRHSRGDAILAGTLAIAYQADPTFDSALAESSCFQSCVV